MTRTKSALSTIAVAGALILAGCSATPDADESSPSPTATSEASVSTTPTPSPDPSPTSGVRPTVDTISCESMLDPLVDQKLRSSDLLPFEKPWTQFGFEPTGAAIECPWGVEGSVESATYFAWSALAEGEGEEFLALTAQNGYTTTVDERGTWVMEPAPLPGNSSILVTDEWIAIAPTPEDISAIIWTR